RLDLRGGQPVPGDVHHVIHPAEQPQVAVLVVLGAVPGEVGARELRPVGVLEPLVVTPDGAQHRWPRFVDHQVTAATGANRLAGFVPHVRVDTGTGDLGGAGLVVGDAG